jgi:predicted membrane-bound dolichyl-phosphate-mannose-protein mannosyltransferase
MAASCCSPLLAAANVALVGRLIAHRGWLAALAACGLMAVYPATYIALLDGMLEPLMCFFCLLGAVLVFDRDGLAGRRRLVAGGAAFGFAGAVLVAAVLPVLVVMVLCASRFRRRLLPFVGGSPPDSSFQCSPSSWRRPPPFSTIPWSPSWSASKRADAPR